MRVSLWLHIELGPRPNQEVPNPIEVLSAVGRCQMPTIHLQSVVEMYNSRRENNILLIQNGASSVGRAVCCLVEKKTRKGERIMGGRQR